MHITELTKWVVNRGDDLYSLDKQVQFKRKLEQYAKEQLNLSGVIVPKGTVCGCENPDICQDNTGVIYCFDCKEPMTEQTAL